MTRDREPTWTYMGKVDEPDPEEEQVLSDWWLLLPITLFVVCVPLLWIGVGSDISNPVLHGVYSVFCSALVAMAVSFGVLLLWAIRRDAEQ